MKKYFLFFIIIFSFKSYAQNLNSLFENSYTNIEFLSTIDIDIEKQVKLDKVKKWISNNSELFEDVSSVKITSEKAFLYGVDFEFVKKIEFVKAENSQKRKNYFAEIARKKEEARLAEIRRQEEIKRQEQERLAYLKQSIENGTFTGDHYYQYSYGKYIGSFVNGKPDGYGEQYFGNGNWYKGNFKNGYRHGYGNERIKESDDLIGLQISGNYINGKREGVFKAFMGTMISGYDRWEMVFENGILISNAKTSSNNSDFWKDSSGDYSSSNNSSSSNDIEKENCEKDALEAYKNVTIEKEDDWIKYALYSADDKMIYFSDGYKGKIYREYKNPQYSISNGSSYYVYIDYNHTLQALYVYKKCGIITKIGLKE